MTPYDNINNDGEKRSRLAERLAMLGVTIVLAWLFFTLYSVYKKSFASVEEGYKNGSVVNLNSSFDETAFKKLLKTGNYYQDDSDIDVITGRLKEALQKRAKGLENLGTLNKASFNIDAAYADSLGGAALKQRVETSLKQLNYDATVAHIYTNGIKLPYTQVAGPGSKSISVYVRDETRQGIEGVAVKLTQYFDKYENDSMPTGTARFEDSGWVIKNGPDTLEYVRFAMTGSNGGATFSGLAGNGWYSVLPVKKGFEYGAAKGSDNLTADLTNLVFVEKKHSIKLFDTNTYNQLKEDGALTVRTPAEFTHGFILYFVLFLAAWWAMHVYLWLRGKTADQVLLPLIMLLCGVCVLTMYSINSPLTDELRGDEMAQGSIAGLLCLFALYHVDIVKFYNSRVFDFAGLFQNKRFNQPGYVYLLIALLLTGALLFFGTGPEGSGVKVNLFFFQPSEITKYLVVIFLAAFFQKNAEYFSSLPAPGERFLKALPAMLLLAGLMGLYLVLGDMGPALVVCGLFIVYYAVASGDFLQAMVGSISYVLLLYAAACTGMGTKALLLATAIWAVLWWVYGRFNKKTFFASAFYLVLVIAAFVFGEKLPGVGSRLVQRNQMFTNIWNNQTYGGDQVAHGIWAIASGGFTGQGPGQGAPKVMPASYTDMVLASIGEELGLAGLVVIIICVAVLLHRSLIIARNAAHPFVFYLAAGIAIVTGIQFLIISAGCFGLMPLTGITVPFLSYGKVSMVINIAAFGIVLSTSALTGDKRQTEHIRKTYDNTIVFGSTFFVTAAMALVGTLLFYQVIKRDEYIVKPAVVVSRTGERIVSVNPRINLLINKLEPGNVYDRNGLLLATSNKADLLHARDSILAAGIADSVIDQQQLVKLKRYYPFGADMFFWVGDYNTRLFWNNTAKGYFAESRHLTLLRGFNTAPAGNDSVKYYYSDKFRPEQFLPNKKDSFSLALYNYRELVPMLKAGINSKKVEDFNKIRKDITLSADARMQTSLQSCIQRYIDSIAQQLPAAKNWRTSVVVLNASTGEVYSSATNPLPGYAALKRLSLLAPGEQRRAISRGYFGVDSNAVFTEADLGVTLPTAPGSTAKIMSAASGLNKLGMRADTSYQILGSEIIRTGGGDPDPVGKVDMADAIIHSSNVYFIRLVNDFALDRQMADIYQAAGVSIAGKGNYGFENNYNQGSWLRIRQQWQKVFNDRSRRVYYPEPKNDVKKDRARLKSEFSGLAWGQGKMTATPLAMARVAGAIANNGLLKNSKFLIKSYPAVSFEDTSTAFTSPANAKFIGGLMYQQSATKKLGDALNIIIAGKTGTPERSIFGNEKNYDGWYLFYLNSPKANGPLAVCIRIEKAGGSGQAVRMAQYAIIPALEQLGYIVTGKFKN